MSQNSSGGLRRSQKADFSGAAVLRERSFVKQSSKESQQHKRRSQTMAAVKGKPTMEIYRPPNVRIDVPQQPAGGKLNVHAKEFTMGELQTSKSSGNLALFNFDCNVHPLQQSKSSGNVLRHLHGPSIIPIVPLPLIHSSSTQLLNHLPRVNFQMTTAEALNAHHQLLQQAAQHQQQQQQQQQQQKWNNENQRNSANHALRRSKSTGAAEIRNLTKNKDNLLKPGEIDLGITTPEHVATIKLAIEDPNQLPSRTLMDLAKIIMERVVEGIKYSEAGAKLCVTIIEKERTQTFIESLINTCQQWYQERDKILRGIKAGDGTRFSAFMWFLTEMCGQLKRHQLRDRFENLQPDLVLLSLLTKCCQACVSLPIKCLAETECLFFVLTSIGRDLENELPAQLEQLLASVRDGFLASAGSPSVRKTLLQLIELHASNWQLPGSSVLYYYPRIK